MLNEVLTQLGNPSVKKDFIDSNKGLGFPDASLNLGLHNSLGLLKLGASFADSCRSLSNSEPSVMFLDLVSALVLKLLYKLFIF